MEGALYYMGKAYGIYFSFHQKWSKLGTFLQTDANEAEMKKKLKNFDSVPTA